MTYVYESRRFADTPMEFAEYEIRNTYGNSVILDRKSLHKFGRNENVGTTQAPITYWGGEPIRSTTNSITHISSTDAADTQTITIEGMTISGGDLTFVIQTVVLNGQTKTAITTPLARCTRVANVVNATETAGDVYVYEDDTVTAGVPDTATKIANMMPAEYQSSQFGGTSIASTNYFVMTDWWVTLNKKTAAKADIQFKVGGVGLVQRSISMATLDTSNDVFRQFIPHYIIPPNSDLHIYATADGTGVDISAGFSGYFADIV